MIISSTDFVFQDCSRSRALCQERSDFGGEFVLPVPAPTVGASDVKQVAGIKSLSH